MTRRELREHCFKMLFSVDFYTTGEEAKAQMQQYFQSPEEDDTAEDGSLQVVHKVAAGEKDREYLSTRTADVVDKIEEIDAKIDEVAAGWKTKRMGKVELTILRLAVYEMLYDDTIPEKVSVNEAVELAKKFGGNESPAFVNGVLAKFIPKEEKKEEAVIDLEPKEEITFEQFGAMQFQVGEIIACEAVKKSKKLLCSQVKIGSQVKQIVSGIKAYYTPEEMVGKKVMVLVNLKPAKLAGVLSEGMLLCAEDADGNFALMTPEKEMPAGAEIC